MNLDMIERRRDPRTQSYVPITLRMDGEQGDTPAHLLDLSSGGAAVLTTAYNAPSLGQHIDLEFELAHDNDSGDAPDVRRETGVVVNMRTPERGVTRVGIRFLQNWGTSAGLCDPLDILSDHRRNQPADVQRDRWDTARNFDRLESTAPSAL